MRNPRVWLFAAIVAVTLGGSALLIATAPTATAAAEQGDKDHWRNHDGKWSYWHAADKRWYYTDGSHWYYNEKGKWDVYKFDRQFGKEGFERGKYEPPGINVKINLPIHGVWRPD
jgi:hypothetical protein